MKDKVPPGTKIILAIAAVLSPAGILCASYYAYGGSDAQGLSSEATASQMK
jgi:hypothetical protein